MTAPDGDSNESVSFAQRRPSKVYAVVVSALAAALSTSMIAHASPIGFRQQANLICKSVLGEIHDPPSSVTSTDQLTRGEGDRWLGSAAIAFANLSRELERLSPPPSKLATDRAMSADFLAVSRIFVSAKIDFDQGKKASLTRRLSAAAVIGGRAARLAGRLGLGQCGP